MIDYEAKEFDNDELLFLRANTVLGPVAKLKIMKVEESIDKFRNWYLKLEGELLETNYTVALELEYEIRLKAWQNRCLHLWKQYGDGLSLEEFSLVVMHQNMEKNEAKIKNRK